jgi:RNA processing factor Prp31
MTMETWIKAAVELGVTASILFMIWQSYKELARMLPQIIQNNTTAMVQVVSAITSLKETIDSLCRRIESLERIQEVSGAVDRERDQVRGRSRIRDES